jgi:hypothetical protein
MLGPRSGDLNNLTRSGRCYTRCYSHSVLPRHAVFNVAPWLLSESACFDCSPDVLILAYSYLRGVSELLTLGHLARLQLVPSTHLT